MANQMQGQLRVASDLGQGARVDGSLAQQPDSTLQRAASEVAQTFSGIASTISGMADRAAVREGEEAGRLAGLDPEFRPTRANTLRGVAFDKAGLDIAETRFRQQIESEFDAAFQQSGGSAGKLTASLGAKRLAILSAAPQELRPDLELLMQGKQLHFSRELARREADERAAAAHAAIVTQVDDTLKGLHQRAYALGLDPMADAVLGRDVEALTRTLSRRGPDGQRLVTPAAAAKTLESIKETTATARVTGAFGRLPTLAAKEQFIKEFEADFASSKGLAQIYDLAGFERVKGSLEADLRSARAQASAVTRALQEDIKSVAKRAEAGYPVPPDEMAAIRSRTVSASDPEAAQALQVAESTLAFQTTARRSTPAELEAFVQSETQRLQNGGATPDQVARVDMGQRLLGTMRTELKQDPLGWAARVGVMKVAPLNLTNDAAAAASVKTRIAQAEELAQYYGQEPKYLTPDEGRVLAAEAAKGGASTIGIATTLAAASGDRAPAVLAQVFDHAPAIAVLGAHVADVGVTQVAQDASNGLALLKTEGVKPMAPSAEKARLAAMEVAGEALRSMPATEAATIALANAAYEVRARQRGVTDFDAALWQAGFREVLGERTIDGDVYGGVAEAGSWWQSGSLHSAVVVPPNVKKSGFSDLLAAITIDDLAAAGGVPLHGDGKPATLASLRRARLIQAGAAKYMLALGDDDDPQLLKAANDEPYVLDLRALEPRLMRRRPDLYLGGR